MQWYDIDHAMRNLARTYRTRIVVRMLHVYLRSRIGTFELCILCYALQIVNIYANNLHICDGLRSTRSSAHTCSHY